MKKRLFILVSTILCAIVTISLVTYTVVDLFAKKPQQPAVETPPTADVGVGSGDLTSDSHTLHMIVGDTYAGDVLTAENYTGTLFAVDNGQLVAANAGTESLSVVNGSVIYTCTINVYEKGDGSQENPYNIVRAEDLIVLVSENEGEAAFYSQRCDLDLSGFESWAPIGKLTAPFLGTYEGNGFAIKNMKIVVTPENVNNYVDNAQAVAGSNGTMLTTGFFGFVGDPLGNVQSEIKNLSISSAVVDTTAIEAPEVRSTLTLTQSYVGVMAGYVINANVSGAVEGVSSSVTSTINSSLFCDDITSTRGAVSAFIGGAKDSEISAYNIASEVTAKNPGYVKELSAGKFAYYGGTIAGVLGRSQNTNAHDFEVQLSVTARNYENTTISGAIGYITDTNTDNTIKNINVNNLYVKLTTYSYTSDKAGIIAGAVAGNLNEQCVIENVNVNNAIVNAIGSGQVSGIVDTNYGTIKNCSVSGLFKGTVVAGIVYVNYGTICYDETHNAMHAVDDVKIVAQTKGAGVAIYNYGTLRGSESLTQIKATIEWSVVRKDFEKNQNNFMMAGIAVSNTGTIENFHTVTFLKDAVNAGGLVGWMEAGSIKNVIVNTSIRTIAGQVGAAVYAGKSDVVGGVVAIVNTTKSVLIENVSGNVTLNHNVSGTYGVNIYGTIIGKSTGNVTIKSTSGPVIEAKVFTNYSSAAKQYIGYLVGFNTSGTITVDKAVRVIISVPTTAQNAILGSINK